MLATELQSSFVAYLYKISQIDQKWITNKKIWKQFGEWVGARVQLIYIGFKERQTQLEKDGTGETERKKR